MARSLEQIAQHALDTALAKGAAEVAVRVGRTRFTSLSFRDRKLDKSEASTSSSLTLTLFLDGRYSSNSTCDLRPDAVADFCDRLVAMTRKLAPDPHRRLPEPEYYQGRSERDLGIYDDQHAALGIDRRKELARSAEEEARGASDRVISATATFYDDVSDSVRLHSNGFRGNYNYTSFWAQVESSVRGDGDKKPEDWSVVGARKLANLGDPAPCGRDATLRALQQIGAGKIDSARLPLVIENRAAGRLLGHLLQPLNASAIQQKRSCYADLLGKSVASAKLTLIDDPWLVGGFGSRLYDNEGITSRPMPIIEQGVLKNFYVDVYYGRKLGLRATTGIKSNLVFSGGQGGLEDLTRGVERGVLVTGFIGGNSSPATGDFSLGVRGFLIEKGQRGQPIAEMNITDNLLTFWNKLVSVGADPYLYSSSRTPSLRFDDVQFSGM
ncbi:MAG: TldD/PmbA family protein [Deltaproteobacteria bacterium]|nr:TldD/PmbA family protein [Deltaproteobacteria bacterium]